MLDAFEETAFSADRVTHPVLPRAGDGPGVAKDNPHPIPETAHSVLTNDLDEDGHPTRAALDRTLAFLLERHVPSPA